MLDIFSIETTYTLLEAVERIDQPLSFLADTFFNNRRTVETEMVAMEYRKQGRQLAPYVVRGGRGVDVSRSGSKVKYYSPPIYAPRRTIGLYDITHRQFGEIPNLYSPVTPEERAAKMQAEDLADLLKLHANRRGQLASEILQTGKVTMKAYADDGLVAEVDEIDYGWSGSITPTIAWSNANAKIYDDLKAASEKIQEDTGEIPTLAICGKNIEGYLIQNKEIKDWLLIPNRQNIAMASFAPRYTSPQVRYIGYISALNMELVSYAQTYIDENGQTQYYVDPDNVIIGVPGKGKEIHAPVTIFTNDGKFQTISAAYVPNYTFDINAQTTALTVYAKYILVPEMVDDWVTIKAV